MTQSGPKIDFLGVFMKFSSYFLLEVTWNKRHHKLEFSNFLYKRHIWENWFASYRPKYSCPIRLLDSLIDSVSESNASISLIFLHKCNIYVRLILCSGMPSYAQIWVGLLGVLLGSPWDIPKLKNDSEQKIFKFTSSFFPSI